MAAKASAPKPTAEAPRGRGRPRIGGKLPITLSDEQRAHVEQLGGGIAAEGIRLLIDRDIAASRNKRRD